MTYLWLKAFHIVAVTAWMAGLFYLPRLFVYHSETPPHGETSELFKTMERRLLRGIMYPAMVLSWGLGLTLGWVTGVLQEWPLWFTVKAVAVVVMTGFNFWLGQFVQAFGRDQRLKPARYFRVINEVPTVLLIVIVILAVLKPL